MVNDHLDGELSNWEKEGGAASQPRPGSPNRYDIYVYEPDRDVIIGWNEFEALDDEVAIGTTLSLQLAPPVELWADSKLVKRWEDSGGVGGS